jgi:hypothetical protein
MAYAGSIRRGAQPVPTFRPSIQHSQTLDILLKPEGLYPDDEFFFWIVPIIDRISTQESRCRNCVNQSEPNFRNYRLFIVEICLSVSALFMQMLVASGSHYFYAEPTFAKVLGYLQ